MRGFAKDALIVLPKIESIETRGDVYQNYFRESLLKLIKYLRSIDITPRFLNMDETAVTYFLDLQDVDWLSGVPEEDLSYLKRLLPEYSTIPIGDILNPTIFESARKKYPTKRGATRKEREALFDKREKYVTREVINDVKIVIDFSVKNNAQYKVPIKEGDGRIVIVVNHSNFIPTVYLSGQEMPAVEMLQLDTGASPVYKWEV